MASANPIEVLRANRREIVRGAEDIGKKKLRAMLGRAQADLAARLRRAEGLHGPGKDSFTAVQMRVALGQLETVLSHLKYALKDLALDAAIHGTAPAVDGVIQYMQAAEKKFAGVTERLPLRDALLFERAASGVRSSALRRLEGDPKAGPGILDRYGDAVVEKFEGHMQRRLLARAPWEDVRNGIIADSSFLQQAPAHWAERIVRTEAMNGSNRAIWEANKAANDQLGDVVKILSATFDNRTGADSVAVHGQIRKPNEAFMWWGGLYQHPPNRPNDREVVVTHRISWPLPPELAWRSDAEVVARWIANGRTGSPPPRPKMTTVPLDKFGATPPPEPVIPTTPIIEPPEVPQRPKRGPVASPFFDENVAPFHSPEPLHVSAIKEPPTIKGPPDDYMATAEGGQKGSNPGGFYRGSDGVLRYVKFYADPTQAELERLANNIYKDLGLPAVKSDTFTAKDGKKGYASEVVEGETLKQKGPIAKADAKKILKGFAADVLVGNWDAVGLELDNVVMSKGKAIRIDNGGALLHRAKAGLKPVGVLNKIDEWEKFFQPSTNPAYAKVAQAAGVTKAEDIEGLKGQIQAIQKLKKAHGSWGNYVDHTSPNLPTDIRQKVVSMLSERSRLLDDKLKILKLPKEAPPKNRIFESLPEGPMPEDKHRPEGLGSREQYQAEIRKRLAIINEDDKTRAALHDYTGGGYGNIRAAGHMTADEFLSARTNGRYKEYREKYERIDALFDHAPTTGPEANLKEAFRGLGQLSRATFDRIVGAEHFEAESVTSAAWDPGVAKNFMYSDASNYSILMHFKFQPNTRTKLAIETHSSQGDYEKEVLIRKGTRFRVTEVRKSRSKKNTAVVELEEIAASPSKKK